MNEFDRQMNRVPGQAPNLPRTYARAATATKKKGRKGRKAQARMRRILLRRFDLR